MIPNDVVVFDGVAHVFDLSPQNYRTKGGEMVSQHLYAFHQVLTPEGEPKLAPEQLLVILN